MQVGSLFQDVSPYARVSTAVVPFLGAVVLRLLFGKNRITQILLSLATLWFCANILMAPYSEPMQRDLRELHIMR